MLFIAVATQWTVSPSGQPIGINYVSLEATMNILSIKKNVRAALFADVRLMELEALDVFREKQACQH